MLPSPATTRPRLLPISGTGREHSVAIRSRSDSLFCLRLRRSFSAVAMASSVSGFTSDDPRIPRIASSIRTFPDFPKPGVMFQDVFSLFQNPTAFRDCIDIFAERYRDMGIDVVAGIEARGLIFGSAIALAIGVKFVALRKPKKLPGEVISEEYELEYGKDKIEMQVGAVQPGDRVVVADDVIATGGTMSAAINLIEHAGGKLIECTCVIQMPELKGREKLRGTPLFILLDAKSAVGL